MTTRAEYVRQAERAGTELVFETAAGLVFPFRPDLPLRELGYLSLRLQHIDSNWRLPKSEGGSFPVLGLDGAEFARMLVAEGVAEPDACRMAMVSRRTLQRRQHRAEQEVREEVACIPIAALEPAFQSGETATDRETAGNGSGNADLSHRGRYGAAA